MSNLAKVREFSLANNFGSIGVTIHCCTENLQCGGVFLGWKSTLNRVDLVEVMWRNVLFVAWRRHTTPTLMVMRWTCTWLRHWRRELKSVSWLLCHVWLSPHKPTDLSWVLCRTPSRPSTKWRGAMCSWKRCLHHRVFKSNLVLQHCRLYLKEHVAYKNTILQTEAFLGDIWGTTG